MDNSEQTNEPRAKRQKTNHKSAAFERLKQLKGKGSKNKYEVSDMDNVYEVVDEKEYSKNVWERQEDDWIVDDDGSGYVEDGRDIFDDDLDSESIACASKNTESKKRKKNLSKNAAKGNIQAMLSNMPEKKKEAVNLDQDDILSDLLLGIDDNESSNVMSKSKTFTLENSEKESAKEYMKNFAPKPVKLKIKSNTTKSEKCESIQILKEKYIESNNIELSVSSNKIQSDENQIDKEDLIIKPNISEIDEIVEDPQLDDEFQACFTDIDIELSNNEQKENTKSNEIDFTSKELSNAQENEIIKKVEMNFINNDVEFSNPQQDENTTNEVENDYKFDNNQLPLIQNSQEEHVFRFFWWDAFEDAFKHPGSIFLFGKTYVESHKTYASCCVEVKNIERKIFLLPRPFHYDTQLNEETNQPVKLIEVYEEFNNNIANSLKLRKFKSRKVNKKYAFDPDVPVQSDYLEVRYEGNALPVNKSTSGRTFSHIFGTQTKFLEIFLLERKIKGPCWLEIKHPKPVSNPRSWCKYEIECLGPAAVHISTDDTKMLPPPLVVATINIRTVSTDAKKTEIVMIGCLIQSKYHVDKQISKTLFQQNFCVCAKPTNEVLEYGVTNMLKKYKETQIEMGSSEKQLLNIFLNRFATIDPDLVVGHDLFDFHLGLLCDRIEKIKPASWSRFGRLKRTIVPTKNHQQKKLMTGRLVCDLKVSARELIKSRSYDLNDLCQTVLNLKEGERPVIESGDIIKMFSSSELFLKLVSLTMQDASYIAKIMYELNVIPLALQITKIAGNVISKTLEGGRAQRNEFLLLHAFSEKNYICPDDLINTRKNNNISSQKSAAAKKKPTYLGGLVLAPNVGFYDKFILLMDFNSLYPSIIQEYNICFTTMPKQLDTEIMLSSVSTEPGVLPTEIRKLVESRREVKKLMAHSDISMDLRAQYNIRQLALKLTANSMYGCLGFQNSRFYAKHLASLVTLKGRDILMHTRDLVQSMGFEVIYGDTDSIMINTNIVDFDQVFKIGNNIKQSVNKLYKQIELDVDGVFKYMLLLKKKKYAAVTITKNKKGEIVLQQEFKGLDIVRRDWSLLASEVGKMILNHVLSDQSPDERIENIQMVLEKVATDLKEGRVPISLLVITKQLTKNPKSYAEKVPLSHVLVALRYNEKNTKPLSQGDTVPYIICEDGTTASSTQRAYHVDELKHSDSLKVDINYYLAQQIHPVVSRLCEPIEGLDAYQIANFLGIDAKSFKKSKPKPVETESSVSSAPVKKFLNVKPFEFVCVGCKQTNTINNLVETNGSTGQLWLNKCSNNQCLVKPIDYYYSVENTLVLNIKNFIEQYYNKTLICEDPFCTNETNRLPLKFLGRYSICNVCGGGVMYRKYSERDLYQQILFYKSICDTSKLDKKLLNTKVEEGYQRLKESVDYFLKRCGYSIVSLTQLFKNTIVNLADKKTDDVEELEYNSDQSEDSM